MLEKNGILVQKEAERVREKGREIHRGTVTRAHTHLNAHVSKIAKSQLSRDMINWNRSRNTGT